RWPQGPPIGRTAAACRSARRGAGSSARGIPSSPPPWSMPSSRYSTASRPPRCCSRPRCPWWGAKSAYKNPAYMVCICDAHHVLLDTLTASPALRTLLDHHVVRLQRGLHRAIRVRAAVRALKSVAGAPGFERGLVLPDGQDQVFTASVAPQQLEATTARHLRHRPAGAPERLLQMLGVLRRQAQPIDHDFHALPPHSHGRLLNPRATDHTAGAPLAAPARGAACCARFLRRRP